METVFETDEINTPRRILPRTEQARTTQNLFRKYLTAFPRVILYAFYSEELHL